MTDPFAWRHSGPASTVMNALTQRDDARFVGGCVRDSLLGAPPGPDGATDIDIATPLLPDEVTSVLEKAKIRCIPTGVEHGTVTAIVGGTPVEVTTLRADVSTDGRRATVEFTRDWSVDAQRRDFTMNALYFSNDGDIFDVVGGQADLHANRVRFIGSPADRIREDALRILRFMRFTARFAQSFDPRGWAACVAEQGRIDSLSKERIWQELKKTFNTPGAPTVFRAAEDAGMLTRILGQSDCETFSRVHRQGALSSALGVASLWPRIVDTPAYSDAFKLSNEERDTIVAVHRAAHAYQDGTGLKELLFRFGKPQTLAGLRLVAGHTPEREERALADREIAEILSVPVSPFRGEDFLRLGLMPGAKVGAAIRYAEKLWINSDFPTDPNDLARVRELALAEVSSAVLGEKGQ